MILPRVAFPTGTEIGFPVSVTFIPLTTPSVVCMARVRTLLSPRCDATSSVMSRVGMPFSELPGDSNFKALSIAGSSFSNSTSTTAPITCDTLPSFIMHVLLYFVLVLSKINHREHRDNLTTAKSRGLSQDTEKYSVNSERLYGTFYL